MPGSGSSPSSENPLTSSMGDNLRDISIVGSEEFNELRKSDPKDFAAGIPAVKVALQHAQKEMGLQRSIKTLSKLNQKEGIDCPGCAWPDPQHRSNLGEFCENGVKAVAEEATASRVTPDFFAKNSINDISRWSDYEIGKSGRITDPMILEPGEIFYTLKEAFEALAKDPTEKVMFQYFDFIAWAESKINNESFAEAAKRRYDLKG